MRKSSKLLMGAIAVLCTVFAIAVILTRRASAPSLVVTTGSPSMTQTKSPSPVVLDEPPARMVAPAETLSSTERKATQAQGRPELEQQPTVQDSASLGRVTLIDRESSERAAVEANLTRYLDNQANARARH